MDPSGLNYLADQCTAFPDQLFGVSLKYCCWRHDLAYAWLEPKITADLELALCVSKAGLGWVGLIMLLGVTVFGWAFYPRTKRK